jgi:hypothetical protein
MNETQVSFADKLLEEFHNTYTGLCIKCYGETIVLSNGTALITICNTCKYWCVIKGNEYRYSFLRNDEPSLSYTIDKNGIVTIRR